MNAKTLLLTVLFPAILVSCGKSEETSKPKISFAVAESGSVADFERNVTSVRWENVAELSFKAPGRISKILVTVGDRVEKGQLLATVDNREAEISAGGYAGSTMDLANLESAARAIGDSTKSLAASRAEVGRAEVSAAEIGKRLAERDLELARKNLENSKFVFSGSTLSASERVRQAETSLSLAENQLKNTTALLQEQEASLRSSALASLAGAFVNARSARDFMDEILGITDENRHRNDAYDEYLGVKDSASLPIADSAFRKFDAKYRETHDWHYANVAGKNDIPLSLAQEALSRASQTLILERESLHALKSVLEKTVESSALPGSEIDRLSQKTDAFLSNLESSLLTSAGGGIDGTSRTIAAFEKNRELQLVTLSESVRLAETALEIAKSGKTVASGEEKRNVDALEIAVRVKEEALAGAEEDFRKAAAASEMAKREMETKIKEAEAKESEARAKRREAETGLALSEERVGYSEIRAPFSGIITEKYAEIGNAVSPERPVLQISDDSAAKAVFSFDASKFQSEMGDEIALVSVRSGKTFTGTVMTIAQTDSFVSMKRRMEISIPRWFVEIGERVRINLEGMSEGGVTIPESTIVTRYLVPSVFVVESGRAASKPVKIRARGGGRILVEGISSGTKIIAEGKDRVTEGQMVE